MFHGQSHGSARTAVAQRVIVPAVLILAVSFAAIVGILFVAGRTLDRHALSSTLQVARSALGREQKTVARFAKDYAWWDEGFRRLVLWRDARFANNNIGWYAAQSLDMASSFVIAGDNSILFAFVEGKKAAVDPFKSFQGGFDKLVAQARAAPEHEPVPATGFLVLDGAVHMVTVCAFTPELTHNQVLPPGPRAVLVFSRVMDADLLREIGSLNMMRDAQVVGPDIEVQQTAAIPLEAANGAVLGHLTWNVELPGRSVVDAALPWLAAAFAAMTALLWLVQRRSQAIQDGIARTSALLAEKNTELEAGEAKLRQAMDAVALASRGKSEFLANLSHELRTPLNAVIGFSELIDTQAYGPVGNVRYKEYGNHIYRSARHMLELLDDTLDISRAEIGALELADSEIDFCGTVNTAVQILSEVAKSANVSVQYRSMAKGALLRADARRVRQMAINLLSNSIKFTPPGGEATVECRQDASGGLELAVSDTGQGIAPEDIGKALAPFTRLKTNRRMVEGAGIGLPLTRHLIELHGGTLVIDSLPGKGTTVVLRFPPERTVSSA